MGLPPESSVVEVDFREVDGRTIVKLTHRGTPPEFIDAHRMGWEFFVHRSRELLEVSE